MTNPVNADQLRVTVEMGDDYQPSERLAAALTELGAALTETDDDVGGFGYDPLRSFLFSSGSPAAYQGEVIPKLEAFPKVEGFYKAAPIWKW
jgi:hypothetical protein